MKKLWNFLKSTKWISRILLILWLLLSLSSINSFEMIVSYFCFLLLPAIIIELCSNPVAKSSDSKFFVLLVGTRITSRVLFVLWVFFSIACAGTVVSNYFFTFPIVGIFFLLPAFIIEYKKNPVLQKNQETNKQAQNNTVNNKIDRNKSNSPKSKQTINSVVIDCHIKEACETDEKKFTPPPREEQDHPPALNLAAMFKHYFPDREFKCECPSCLLKSAEEILHEAVTLRNEVKAGHIPSNILSCQPYIKFLVSVDKYSKILLYYLMTESIKYELNGNLIIIDLTCINLSKYNFIANCANKIKASSNLNPSDIEFFDNFPNTSNPILTRACSLTTIMNNIPHFGLTSAERKTWIDIIKKADELSLEFYRRKDLFKRQFEKKCEQLYSEAVSNNYKMNANVNEQILFLFIRTIFPDAIYQYRTPWLTPLSIDIYIPEKKLAIEYQGKQHYEAVSYFGGEESLVKQQERDARKKKLCRENNIILLEWPYTLTITPENIENFLVKQGIKKQIPTFHQAIDIPETMLLTQNKTPEPHKKTIIQQLDDNHNVIAEYISIGEASTAVGISASSIYKALRGERKHAGGYKWKRV